jgi:putative cell wall-binding protein
MNKKVLSALGGTAVFSLVMSAAVPAATVSAASASMNKIEGEDVYKMAVSAAESNWTSSEDVILVSGESYADAISAVVLSKQLDAPVLFTGKTSLNSDTQSEISKLNAKNVYIVGGTGVISQAVRNQLKSYGCNLVELGGANRYATNSLVAKKLVDLGMDPSNVMMVGGSEFSDALSAAPVASAKGEILLLGGNDKTAMTPIVNFVKSNSSKVTVIGTNNLVNDETYKSVGAVERINGGSDRFATNLNVLKAFDSTLKSDNIYVANATGSRYADALVSASIAGIKSAPLVLVNGNGDTQTTNALNYIKSKASSASKLNVISEKGAVSDSTVSDIENAANGIVGTSDTVNSVSTVGLNQIKVVFNTKVDKTSAERAANYEIDGNQLGSEAQTQASATLQDDGRTVILTFRNPFSQGKNVTFKVKDNVLSDDSSRGITEYEKEVTFSATGTPSIASVTPIGGNKIEVRFSEAIRMQDSDLKSMKINKRNVTNYGYNKSYTKLVNQCGDWASGVDLYFNSPLPIGQNTFTMPTGTSGSKFDNAANIPMKGQSENFTVEAESGTPKVESVTSNNAGTLYIKFDRPMDTQTALDPDNYKINGDTVDVDKSYITFDADSGDSVVKIKNLGGDLDQGTNTILVDDDVEDTFGNNIVKTTKTLYYGSSSEKPEVTSASILDDETIRIKFSKDVVRSGATNKGNYTIEDSDGNDISYKIKDVSTITVDGNNNRTFDLNFQDGALKGSDYKLTVKNVIDTEAKPNVIDTYTVNLSGTDENDNVEVSEIVKRADNDKQVAMFFSKTMDEDSISDKSNYLFKDGTGSIRSLPGGAVITTAYDDKSVTIEFPSSYTIGSGDKSTSVIQVGVKNVVDKNGNSLDLGSYIGDIDTSSSHGPGIISGTAKMNFSGNDLVATVSFDAPIDSLDMNDFRIDGYKPDGGSANGSQVTLIYKSGVKNGEKIKGIKDCGDSTNFSVVNNGSTDAAGRRIRTGSTKVYVPPVTKPDDFKATSASNTDTVNVEFNQDIDTALHGDYIDDFVFEDVTSGKTLTPTSVSVDDKTVVYRFSTSAFDKGDVIKVSANSSTSSISVRSEKHDNAGYTTYSPSSDDLSGYTVTAK